MRKAFYEQKFDDATNLKLEMFRRYLREWLPVFMTRKRGGVDQTQSVDIYDFFAGKGQDAAGNPGSPLIIIAAKLNTVQSHFKKHSHNIIQE